LVNLIPLLPGQISMLLFLNEKYWICSGTKLVVGKYPIQKARYISILLK